MSEKCVRNSSIELLRILALFMVIMIHYANQLLKLIDNDFNYHTLLFLRSFSSPAVDLFLLISGYFMVTNNTRYVGKPLSLLLQVVYRNLFIFTLLMLFGYLTFNFKSLLFYLVPMSYYPLLFVVVYLISPYINMMLLQLKKISDKALRTFCLILFLLFSVYPTMTDFAQELFHYEWFGLNTIGAWGDQQGFNIVNFMLLYIIGGAIRLLDVKIKKTSILKYIFICFIAIFVCSEICEYTCFKGLRSSWIYCNPLVIIFSTLLFCLFRCYKFESNIVNKVATYVYMTFLIHSSIISNFDIGLAYIANGSIVVLILHYLLFSIIMLAMSSVMLSLYNYIWKYVPEQIKSKKIDYSII